MTLNHFAAFVRMRGLHPNRCPVGGRIHWFEKPFRKENAFVLQSSLILPFRWEVGPHLGERDCCSMKEQVSRQGEVVVFFQHAVIKMIENKKL